MVQFLLAMKTLLREEEDRHTSTSFLLQGFVIGFSIAAPVGPIGVLCIRRTLAKGRAYGFTSGLGAATADAIYGCIAGFGLTLISELLIAQQVWLRLIGGVFLCYLGLKTLLSKPAKQPASVKGRGLMGDYMSMFLLTATNPVTILSFAAIFAGLGLGSGGGNYVSATLLVLGVFTGSTLWWFLLSAVVSIFRTRFSLEWLRWLNIISGLIITGFGLFALFGLIGLLQ